MRLKFLAVLLLSSMFLFACSGENTQEDMYEHMEESVQLETEFVEQQQSIKTLEEEEQAIYQEIKDLGIDQYEEITALADEAIASIESRRELTETERESIEASKEEFDNIIPLIDDLEDETLQTRANEMVDAMENRYNAFIALNDAYQTSLDYDSELYQLLKDEELEEEAFTEQVEKVNAQYQVVIEENQAFNDATDQFNEAKRAFYDASDLNISYE
ncbi:putative cell-wall binding lipoprotein [Streptohalobacillus salinus]|uniref:Putative cell-wall binding lipoprotein n=1 Tax=Streptohalobacillus salinus TaxID=621096 RepID=A0A2V3WFV6_9BACI|nr:YkyA family protein [Streptohalobacillus salinus]PXW92639.1 putative cell-wall binding lipoprotein [Streptohalobacillus salinus]